LDFFLSAFSSSLGFTSSVTFSYSLKISSPS